MSLSTLNPELSTPRSIRDAVDRGLAIVEQITALELELDAIEERLVAAGLEGDQVELEDPDREGRQYLAQGSSAVVPIVFTADLLVKSFQDNSDTHNKIEMSIDEPEQWKRRDLFRRFYRAVPTWKTVFDSGKEFRARAAEILGAKAAAFISACLSRDKDGTPKNQIKIEWQRATPIAGIAWAHPTDTKGTKS